MKARTSVKAALIAALFVGVTTAYGAEPAPGAVAVSGEITPKFYYFDYFKGFGPDRTQVLESHNYQKGFTGDRRSDFYLDADFAFTIENPDRKLFTLERVGFGPYNHRGTAQADADKLGFTAYYSFFRSATTGIDYLYSPNQVAGGTDLTYNVPLNTNSGYVAQFNDDSNQFLYKIDRTTYGAGIKLKPAMLGAVASLAIDYDGYRRKGNTFTQYVLGGGDTAPAPLQRWRGFDQEVNETMNRLSFKFGASPSNGFQFAYDLSFEKFDNQARASTFNDIVLPAGFTKAGDQTRPLGFVPDTNLITNGLRLSKNFGSVAVAAGYGNTRLEQDTFTTPQQLAGYTVGKITTDNAFLNVNANVIAGVGLEGFIKYYNRDNDSSFPVAPFIDTVTAERLGVRVDGIRSLKYGLAATFRTGIPRTTTIAGWEHEDRNRDLTFHQATVVPAVNGIAAVRSLYREDTRSDELYVKLISRLASGVTLRVTPYYRWASLTGLVTEPETAYGLKAKATYAAPKGMLVSAFYNYRSAKNDNNSMTSNLAAGVLTTSVTQDTERTTQSAGVSLNMPFGQWINTSASLSWFQDDFENFYFATNRRRFEAPAQPVIYVTRDRPNYDLDTFVLTLGGDYQQTDALRWNGSYTVSYSRGDTASGLVLAELPSVDGSIKNTVHSLALGVDYAMSKATKLRGSYYFDYYSDDVYSALTGGVHTIMVGLTYGF